jgi:hypothetical protein
MVYVVGIVNGAFSGSRVMNEPKNWRQNVELQALQDQWTGSVWVGGLSPWNDRDVPNQDGFALRCSDWQADTIHFTQSGADRVGVYLHDLFFADSTTRPWMFEGPVDPPPPPATYDLLIDGVVGCSSCEWGDVLSGLAPGADVQTITKQ